MSPEFVTEVLANQQVQMQPKAFTAFAGQGFSLNDIVRFEAAMSSTGGVRVDAAQRPSPAQSAGYDKAVFLNNDSLRTMLTPLDKISASSQKMMENSELLAASPDASPGDLLMTMVGVQKFMFECQMTSSVANRTSDGIQELFRQQS